MNKCNLKKIIAFFYFLIFAWSDIQGAEKEKVEEGTDPQIDRVIHVNLNQVEDLVPLLKSHDLSLKKLARDFLRRISENENLQKHPALRELLAYGNESDKIFSREKLFRFLIKNKDILKQQDVATTLFQSSEKNDEVIDDKIIGAEILCSINPPSNLFDLRFEAIAYLERHTCLTADQFEFLWFFASTPDVDNIGANTYNNVSRYDALMLLYNNHSEKYKEKIPMEFLLNHFEDLCKNQEEPKDHLWNSYKILFKHKDEFQQNSSDVKKGIRNRDVLENLLGCVEKLIEEDNNIKYYIDYYWSPNFVEKDYKQIENLYEDSLSLEILKGKAIESIEKDKGMNFYYLLIKHNIIPPFSENGLSKQHELYYGKILWVSNAVAQGMSSFTERFLIETLKFCNNQDFISRVVWNIYETKHFAQFRSDFYKAACRELNVDKICHTNRQFSYFRDYYKDRQEIEKKDGVL